MPDSRTIPQQEDCASTGRLPLRAEALLRFLEEKIGKNDCCWHKQETIAKELGIGVRQVQKWIAYLVEVGRIEIKRMSHTRMGRPRNHYFLLPSEAHKSARCDTNKSAPHNPNKSAHREAQKSAPLQVDELDSLEGGGIETASPPPTAQKKEHPKTEEWYLGIKALEAMPAGERKGIEDQARIDSPLYATDPIAFQGECVAIVLQRQRDKQNPPERESESDFDAAFDEFKREFIKCVPGCPKKDQDFLDMVKKLFGPPGLLGGRGINATREEMLYALECYIFDQRREDNRWPGKFASEAYRFLPKYILTRRKAAQQASVAGVKETAPKQASGPPEASLFAVDPVCAQVGEVIREKIGESRFELWFARSRMTRTDDYFQISGPAIKDFLRTTFGADIGKAIEEVTGQKTPVKFVQEKLEPAEVTTSPPR